MLKILTATEKGSMKFDRVYEKRKGIMVASVMDTVGMKFRVEKEGRYYTQNKRKTTQHRWRIKCY